MSNTVTLGGDRLGSGNKQKINMHGYERSTHDLSYLWKNTQAPGPLVPFMSMVGLPGDTFDIDLDSIVKTHPTIGPLFGSFKLQLDVFTCPIRLYNKYLHNNKLGIGMDISQIRFPLIELTADVIDKDSDCPYEFQQINQSCIFAYLGIRGLGGVNIDIENQHFDLMFNALPFISYWDIFKNYYANKQEENAYVIHGVIPTVTETRVGGNLVPYNMDPYTAIDIKGTNLSIDNLEVDLNIVNEWHPISEIVEPNTWLDVYGDGTWIRFFPKQFWNGSVLINSRINNNLNNIRPKLTAFPLENIDKMREDILTDTSPTFEITTASYAPYSLPITPLNEGGYKMWATLGQEGLAVKTYQSDIFNNWINKEWIEGNTESIASITAISTTGDYFTIDTLNLSKKVYDLLNRVAVSGGSLEDYIEAVYDHKSKWRAETPVYHGGLSKEIIFQEVVSNAATTNEPLGSLAGKGVMSSKHKGGKVIINVDEPCYIIGIVSITPRIDYSQGNNWDVLLQDMNDLHKPALDGIGFQDLITDQMAFWDSYMGANSMIYKSAGKQPAWINYMTEHNRSYGNFADPRSQMFMTLNRRYEPTDGFGIAIKDLTTYIDPEKFNYAFAQTDLSAMNFWVQIAVNIEARRKLSAKIMPNL